MDGSGALRAPVGQFPGDGRQSQEVVVLRLDLVFLEWLPAAAHHKISASVFQHILLCIGFVFVLHQTGGEGEVGSFHRRIAVVHADYDHFTHLVSPRCFSFFAALFRSCSFPASNSFRISWRS